MKEISKSLEESAKIAMDFAAKLKPQGGGATIVGLYGELGAGKTIFMKYLALHFGVEDIVQSPTFVIENVYQIKKKKEEGGFEFLIHIDAYRIEAESEMLNLGWNEIIHDPKNLICVEWPDRIIGIMPTHTKIFFKHLSPTEREISIQE